MRTTLLEKALRPGVVRPRPNRSLTLSTVLGIILFPALLHSLVPVSAATLPNSYEAVLTWEPSPGPAVSGYHIYYGITSGQYLGSIRAGNVTVTTLAGLKAGFTYYFVVTAYDANGNESAYSAEIRFVPGKPAVQLSAAPHHQLVLDVDGLINHGYEVQASKDLKTWAVIGNVTTDAGGSTSFTDTNAALFSKRFYRIRANP